MTTPAVTVKDVWRGVLPEGTQLLAGGGGLERRVEWACALRARPPAFDAVKGGEMAFVPVARIRYVDDRLDLPQVMVSLAEKGGVAVAISGAPSAESIALADRLVMPLLHLPDSAHIGDVHQACVRFILDQRTLLHEHAQELQTALMELALSGATTSAIVERLRDLTGFAALWLDASGSVQMDARAGDLDADRLAAHGDELRRWSDTIPVVAADPPVREVRIDDERDLLASPVPGRHGVGGFVAVVGPAHALDQRTRLAVSRAASACAIALDRERAVAETREQLEGELVASLVTGAYVSEEAAVERCRRVGVQLGPYVQVAVIRSSRALPAWERAALASVRNSVARRDQHALVGAHRGDICVIFSGSDTTPTALERLVDDIRAECAHATRDGATSAGVGRPGPGAVAARVSHREADQALVLARRALGDGVTASFARLGLYRMLFALSQHAEVAQFYEETMGPLLEYDQRTGSGLMATLEALFAANGSPTEAALRLRLHRNTILYRLRRIEEVGHINLDDPLTRLNLNLCLRIREVLHQDVAAPRAVTEHS